MATETIVSSPLDTRYVAHREADERRRQTREWLKKRERELGFIKEAPSVAPGYSEEK